MKKKILLTLLIVSALACLFTISISAATIYNDAEGNELYSYDYDTSSYIISNKQGDGFAKTDSDGNALTWYITATETDANGNTVHTVASLKTLGEAGNINANGAYSFTSPVTNKNTVSVNFPDDSGIKTWAFKSFGGFGTRAKNNILFVYCPNTLTAFENNPFQETPVMVVEIDDETPITSIPQNFCHEARNLTAINIPATVTVINGSGGQNGAPFYNNKSLTTVTFASNTNLVEMKDSCFQNCSSLVSIDLPNSIVSMGKNSFSSCSSLKEISLPNSLKTIANHAFAWCTSLEVIRMGASFEYFNNTGDNSFTYTTGKVKEIYIPNSFYKTAPDTSLGYQVSYAFHGASADCKFFYCGTAQEFEAAKANFLTQKSATSNNGAFINATVITYDEYVANPDKYASGRYVVCEYSTCNAFYDGVHGESTTTYDFKDEIYTSDYCSYTGCQRCNETIEAVVCGPLFVNRGYSKVEDGSSFTYGITINDQNIAKYVEITGESFKYGFVVGSVPTSAHDQIIDSEGNSLLEKTVAVDFTEIDYKNFTIYNVKIVGIDTDEQKGTPIYCCAYVIDGSNISYMGDAVTDKAVSVSSNSITVVEATTPPSNDE